MKWRTSILKLVWNCQRSQREKRGFAICFVGFTIWYLSDDVIWRVFVYIWMVEELWIYLICAAKFLTFLDGGGIWIYFNWTLKYLTFLHSGGILDVFWLYCKIPDISGCWRNFGSILFVLQNSWHFWMLETENCISLGSSGYWGCK